MYNTNHMQLFLSCTTTEQIIASPAPCRNTTTQPAVDHPKEQATSPNHTERYKTDKEAPIILERNINLPYQKLPKRMHIETCTASSPLLYLYYRIELSINHKLLKAKTS